MEVCLRGQSDAMVIRNNFPLWSVLYKVLRLQLNRCAVACRCISRPDTVSSMEYFPPCRPKMTEKSHTGALTRQTDLRWTYGLCCVGRRSCGTLRCPWAGRFGSFCLQLLVYWIWWLVDRWWVDRRWRAKLIASKSQRAALRERWSLKQAKVERAKICNISPPSRYISR